MEDCREMHLELFVFRMDGPVLRFMAEAVCFGGQYHRRVGFVEEEKHRRE